MKSNELVDTLISEPNSPIVIELPNGQRIPTFGYMHSSNGKGEPVIVILAGKRN